MPKTQLLEKTQFFVEDFYNRSDQAKMYYHNLAHTKDVVDFAYIIGNNCQLNESDLETVMIAAWFHDIGYYKGGGNHEKESATMAGEFLKKIDCPSVKIEAVVNCIYATKIPQNPKNIVEKVVCDADLAHLATDDYFTRAENLRKELSETTGKEILEDKWLRKSKGFFEKHHYFTDYGIQFLQIGKKRNYDSIVSKLNQ